MSDWIKPNRLYKVLKINNDYYTRVLFEDQETQTRIWRTFTVDDSLKIGKLYKFHPTQAIEYAGVPEKPSPMEIFLLRRSQQ